MKNNLRISNMVFTGKMPFKRKMREIETQRLVMKGSYFVINEEVSPIFMKKMCIRKNPELSVHKKLKQPCAFIWTSGSINITGLLNRQEANKVYDLVMKDIKKFCGRVLK